MFIVLTLICNFVANDMNMEKNKFIILPLISLLFLVFASCKQKYFYTVGETWGTSYHIAYSGETNLDDSIACELARIDSIFSIFNPSSEVCAINNNTRFVVSGDFAELFDYARHAWRISGGAFDPTVAPVAELWGFGAWSNEVVPDSTAVAAALTTVGMGDCTIDTESSIHKKNPSTRFDFSALAKGYGVDCVARMLKRNKCRNFMVEIGGEVIVMGENQQGRPWRIQVDSPDSGLTGHNALLVIEMGPEQQAIASSGNYRNYRVDSLGNIYGHTIDPHCGYPVQTSTLAASVLAPLCIEADAMATACMVMEPAAALNMLESEGLEGLLVVAQGDSIVVNRTPGFPQ